MLRQIAPGLIACAILLPGYAAHAAERIPQIENVVAGILPQRIEARIRKLAAFHTRHTLSETNSEDRGIGAARRWIKAELEQCGRETGGRLAVSFDSFTQPPSRRIPQAVEITNVVAVLPGTQAGARERHYVVSGHYDSRATDVMDARSYAPGANDDASGVAAMMEMACVMAAQRFDATLVFIAVAGEEQGLFGSTHWAEQAEKQGLRVSAMITNDIIGSSTASDGSVDNRSVRLFANGLPALLTAQNSTITDGFALLARKDLQSIARSGGEFDTPTHQLGRYLKEIGERYVPGFAVTLIPRPDRFLRGGDHLPFLERGYAAVRFTEPAEDYRHQHQDVRSEKGIQYGDLPEFVDFAYVAQVTRVNAAGLASLALAPAAPEDVGIEVSELENDTTLRWRANSEPDLAGYRILWRQPGEVSWRHSLDVGNTTRHTLKGISKDDFVFGLAAVDRDGHVSPASFPRPWRPN
ncbi:MAG: M20/M25/M40 family metallo-hydrolase [Rhodocyclaceae bacterium]|nr:MAG: M20/M25/M40 family metallo-hydrolase [Rhodocyclaceae bacterium]